MHEQKERAPEQETAPLPPQPRIFVFTRRLSLRAGTRAAVAWKDAGFEELTSAHLAVMVWPGPDGARPTELAQRSRHTKQAINHLIQSMERWGYLTREPVPDDKRGSIVRLTERGWQALAVMDNVQAEMENEWRAKLGQRRFDRLYEDLRLLIEH